VGSSSSSIDCYLNCTLPARTVDKRITSLRENICALLRGSGTRQQLEAVVAVCHSLALTHLRSKGAAWRMMNFHGLDLPDLAYDCIADLFQRDENGSLTELLGYFNHLEIETVDSPEVLVHLRRLVFSKVSKNLSGLIAETDSYFFRTTRNIRNAIVSTGKFEEIDRFGAPTLKPRGTDPLLDRPMFVDKELAQLVWSSHSFSTDVPAFIDRLYDAVCSQTDHCRLLYLLPIVALLKEASEKQLQKEHGTTEPDALTDDEARRLVGEARKETDRKFREAYVVKGKVSSADFAAYLGAIENCLAGQISTDDSDGPALFASLQSKIGGLSEEQYRVVHRARVEYMARYMRARVAHYLK
jgi:hypothetical protein